METTENESYRLYELGRARMEAGDLDGAIAQFEESAAACPHFKTMELLGECFQKQGKALQAIAPLAAATALNEQSRAPALLASVFLELGQRDDAERFARLALTRSSGNRKAREVLQMLESSEPMRQ